MLHFFIQGAGNFWKFLAQGSQQQTVSAEQRRDDTNHGQLLHKQIVKEVEGDSLCNVLSQIKDAVELEGQWNAERDQACVLLLNNLCYCHCQRDLQSRQYIIHSLVYLYPTLQKSSVKTRITVLIQEKMRERKQTL